MKKLLASVLAAGALMAMPDASAEEKVAAKLTPYDKYVASGQKAFDHGSFKSAITFWKKALGIAPADNQNAAPNLMIKLAQAVAAQKKYLDANDYLQQASKSIHELGLAMSSEFQAAWNQISPHYRIVDVAVFGKDAAKALTDRSVQVSVLEADSGAAHVDIVAPEKFQSTVKNEQVDEIALDKAVSFDLAHDTAGNTVMSNIKGFRMHIPEKGMWVNLLGLLVKPADAATGNSPAEVTAGKAGITKVVASSLPPYMVAPIDALNKKALELGKPVELDEVLVPQAAPSATDAAPPAAPQEANPTAATP